MTLATRSFLGIACGETQSNEQDPKDPMRQSHRTSCDPEKSVGFIKSRCIYIARRKQKPVSLGFGPAVGSDNAQTWACPFPLLQDVQATARNSFWIRDLLVKSDWERQLG